MSLGVFKIVWDEVSNFFSSSNVVSMMPLYLYPGFIFLNAKVKIRRISKNEYDSKLLRNSYLSKTLVWTVMALLFSFLVLIPSYIPELNNLLPVITFFYLGFSAAMLSMEITSISRNYKEIQQTTYVPILKRKSFWVLLVTSVFNLCRIILLEEIYLPSAAVALIDAGSYGIITLAIFTMLFFDKASNAAQKSIKAAQNLVHILTNTVIKDDKQRAKFNVKVDKVLDILQEVLELSDSGYIPDQDVQQVQEQIQIINELRSNKGIEQKL